MDSEQSSFFSYLKLPKTGNWYSLTFTIKQKRRILLFTLHSLTFFSYFSFRNSGKEKERMKMMMMVMTEDGLKKKATREED